MLGLLSLSREEANEIIANMSAHERHQLSKALKAQKQRKALAERQAAIDSLSAFVRHMWDVVEPRRPLVWSWHMDVICEMIEAYYRHDDQVLRDRFDGANVNELVCNIPPRCSKSKLFSVIGPAWHWLHEPGAQFLCLTKADKNVKRDAREMRQLLMSSKYQALLKTLPEDRQWSLREDQNEVRYYANTLGGHRISATTSTDVIGVGADLIIIDDPHDVEEVALGSPERVLRLMSEVSTKYEEVWKPRLNPYGRTMLVMQRLNDADLAGFIHARSPVKLVLPMEYEPEHELCWPHDPRTEPGEMLHDRFEEAFVDDAKVNDLKWAGQYQQRPSPLEGGTFKREWFNKSYSEAPQAIAKRADEVWLTLDAAGKGNSTSDRSAIQVWARLGADWYLLHGWTGRVNLPELNEAMATTLYQWGEHIRKRPGGILVEDAALGAAWIQLSKGRVSYVIPWHPGQTPGKDKSKGARAMYLQRTAQAGNIYLPAGQPSWLSPIKQDWFSFPNGVHDDHVDSSSMLQVHFANHGMRQVMNRAVSGLVFH